MPRSFFEQGEDRMTEELLDLPMDGQGELHLWDYVHVVLRRLPLAISVFLAVMILAGVYTWTRIPRYTATSRVLLQRSQVNLTDIRDALDPAAAGVGHREYIETQVQLLKSTPVMEAALAQSGLIDSPDFARARDPVRAFSSLVHVSALRNTYLVDVSAEREDPREAARIVNAVVSAYLEENRRRRQGISEEGLEELRRQASVLRERLDGATRELHDFMKAHNIVSFERSANIIVERMQDLSRNLTKVEPRRMELQARVEEARAALAAGRPIDSLPDVLSSPVVRELKLTLARLEQDFAQRRQRLGASHPQLEAMETEMQTVQMKIAMESMAILNSIETAYEQARKEEMLHRMAIEEHKAEVFRMTELAAEYERLNQERKSIEGTAATIIRRIEEIDINRMGGQGETAFVIARASVPLLPSWPGKAKNMAIALVFASGLAVGLCFFLDYMDTTVKGELDVRHALHSEVLGGIPATARDDKEVTNPDLYALENTRSHFAEAFRSLRTSLAFSPHGSSIRSVVVTSTFPSEGKSITSLNLALAQAQIGRRTLLVDTDMRKPRLHKVFDVQQERGLSNYLADSRRTSLDDLVCETHIENLSVLPCGPIPGKSVELLDTPVFDRLVELLKERYDFVVFDSPPGCRLVDAVVIGKRTDGLLLVVRSFVTQKNAAADYAMRVRAAQVPLLGVVLNNVDQPTTAYYGGYYYGRYGYYSQDYYYEEGGAPRGRWSVKGMFKRGASSQAES